MDAGKVAVYATLAIVLTLTVATGPIVGLVTVPDRDLAASSLGEGNLDVTDATVSGTVSLRASRSDDAVVYLRVPDAVLSVESVTGRPLVSYKLNVPALNYSRNSVTALSPGTSGAVSIALPKATLDASELPAESYEVRLRVLVRDDGPERIVFSDDRTVEVER